MGVESKRNWFKRHKILTGIIVFFGLFIILGMIGAATQPKAQNTTSSNSNTSPRTPRSSAPVASSTTTARPQPPTCTSYQTIDSQTWLEIVKDPDSYDNQCYTVYGEVTQFDAATGNNAFLASVGGVQQTPEYGEVDYPTNTYLTGSVSILNSVVEQNLFTANVMVLGSYTYDTQSGGQTTVPQLQVNAINVTGTASD